MDDNINQYKADTSHFLRTLGNSLTTIVGAQKDMIGTVSKIDSVTKAEAQTKLADSLVELSREVSKLSRSAVEFGRRQNLLAQKEENGSSEQ